MSFVTGMLIVDVPAGALNNSNDPIPNARTENTSSVKYIHTRVGDYPYVSAQAVRAWLRNALEREEQWKSSPVYRDAKITYTASNPIDYCDDDLFGYMRAPSPDNLKTRREDPLYKELTPLDIKKEEGKEKESAVTRIAPFRFGTFVSIAPVYITADYGTMVRQETGTAAYPKGPDPNPFEHQFYRATLQGLMSLDLRRVGRFTYRDKSGYRNLDETRKKIAADNGLDYLENEAAYLLPIESRQQRVKSLLSAIANMQGGAKQALHYTDVNPDLVMLAVTKGGNNIFGHVVNANARGLPELNTEALDEAISVNADDLHSHVYVGWVKGYLDEQRARFEEWLKPQEPDANASEKVKKEASHHKELVGRIHLMHPREAFNELIRELDAHAEDMFK